MLLYQAAEKFIKDTYWQDSHDNTCSVNVNEAVALKMVKDNAGKDIDYYGRRDGVFHASSLGGCLRGAVHAQLGTAPDRGPDTRKLGVFKAGNLFEDFIIEALGDKVVHRQREYALKYKNISLVGRSDYVVDDNGKLRLGENKSVNSQSFWYREREGTLVQWHNMLQIQTYLWLERVLNGNEWDGLFSYVSKDDVTVIGIPVKYNPKIIENIIIPSLDLLNEAYTKKDPTICPTPDLVIYSEAKEQWQTNWLCTYCDYHCSCAGNAWMVEAKEEVARKNKQQAIPNPYQFKKEKAFIAPVNTNQ